MVAQRNLVFSAGECEQSSIFSDPEFVERKMREHLPEPFVETILTGWWTTCLEVLPARERRRGKF